MLGHISITALGGCYSQDPDTGKADATYFPAESVILGDNIRLTTTRDAGTTKFEEGFTQTRFWIREQALTWDNTTYEVFAHLGTHLPGSRYTMSAAEVGLEPPRSVYHYCDSSMHIISSTTNPTAILTCYKQEGSNTTVLLLGERTSSRTTTSHPEAMQYGRFMFLTGSGSATTSKRFWGDCMNNHPYTIRWRRLPMQCAERPAVALYNADAQQLVEY